MDLNPLNSENPYRLEVAQATHPGLQRENNEDSFGWFTTARGELFLVADGMGGHVGGAIAGKIAVSAFAKHAAERLGDGAAIEEALKEALFVADKEILDRAGEDPSLNGMGSTIVAFLLAGAKAYFIHAGDSRIYRFSRGDLAQLTHDHSLVQFLVDSAQMSQEDADESSERNIITQSLGGNVSEGMARVTAIDCQVGDEFLLCSDGLTEGVPNARIFQAMSSGQEIQQKAQTLIQLALDAGGRDNVTVQLVSLASPQSEERAETASEIPRETLIVSPLPPLAPRRTSPRPLETDKIPASKGILLVILAFILGVVVGGGGVLSYQRFFSPENQDPGAARESNPVTPSGAHSPSASAPAPAPARSPDGGAPGPEGQGPEARDVGDFREGNGESSFSTESPESDPSGASSPEAAGEGPDGGEPSAPGEDDLN
ncbi:MAG: protein phosphatase 2C domain-containing protein [Deltaproteobacteria bacterium]|jgi:protein phosphatase|nr:protein phosphatase 2C domain-containing protein [Deltaproteobacteria bacterium]